MDFYTFMSNLISIKKYSACKEQYGLSSLIRFYDRTQANYLFDYLFSFVVSVLILILFD